MSLYAPKITTVSLNYPTMPQSTNCFLQAVMSPGFIPRAQPHKLNLPINQHTSFTPYQQHQNNFLMNSRSQHLQSEFRGSFNPCYFPTQIYDSYIPLATSQVSQTKEPIRHLNRSYQVLDPHDMSPVNKTLPIIAHRATYYKHKIFVGSLARNTSPDDLACFFRKFGVVIEAKVILDSDGHSKGYGFVSFATADTVKSILNQGAIYMENKRIAVASAIRKKYEDQDY